MTRYTYYAHGASFSVIAGVRSRFKWYVFWNQSLAKKSLDVKAGGAFLLCSVWRTFYFQDCHGCEGER